MNCSRMGSPVVAAGALQPAAGSLAVGGAAVPQAASTAAAITIRVISVDVRRFIALSLLFRAARFRVAGWRGGHLLDEGGRSGGAWHGLGGQLGPSLSETGGQDDRLLVDA